MNNPDDITENTLNLQEGYIEFGKWGGWIITLDDGREIKTSKGVRGFDIEVYVIGKLNSIEVYIMQKGK